MTNTNKFVEDLESITELYSTNEWAFVDFCEKYINSLSAYEAFEAINNVVPLLFDEKNINSLDEILEVIIRLARKSETTEIPKNLENNIGIIREISNSRGAYAFEKYLEIEKYYRI